MFYVAAISNRKTVQDRNTDKVRKQVYLGHFFKTFITESREMKEARNPCPLSMNPIRSKCHVQIAMRFIKNIHALRRGSAHMDPAGYSLSVVLIPKHQLCTQGT